MRNLKSGKKSNLNKIAKATVRVLFYVFGFRLLLTIVIRLKTFAVMLSYDSPRLPILKTILQLGVLAVMYL